MAFLELMTENRESKSLLLEPTTVNYLENIGQDLKVAGKPTTDTLAAIYRSKHSSVLLCWGDQHLYVNHCKVVVFKIVRDGDQLTIGPYALVFRELLTIILDPESEVVKQGKVCLVCRKPFVVGNKAIYCPACGTAHHESCWQFQKGHCANGKVCRYSIPWDEPATSAT